jgi:hypothetical protein
VPDISVGDAQKNLKKSLEKGILKILSKMGISLLGCYHGAQIFEAYGLSKEVRGGAGVGKRKIDLSCCSVCWCCVQRFGSGAVWLCDDGLPERWRIVTLHAAVVE